MANEYAYNIVLGGKVDSRTLNKSIQDALKGTKFKIKLDQQSIRDQVQNALKDLKINVGVTGGGSGGSSGGGTRGGGGVGVGGGGVGGTFYSKRVTTSGSGEPISEQIKYINSATKATTEYYNAQGELTKVVEDFSQKAAVQADRAYDKLRGRIDALSKSNVVGAKNIKDFNERLAEINQIEDPSKRLAEFQKLNQEISDTKKQSMGLTKQISTAMGKFLIWSAVTVSYFALVRKLKDVVVQVKEIDDALVELKKVSDLTGEEVEKLTDRAFALGETVAKTGIDVIKAITEIKRAGYELSESEYLAKYALMMTNVAEGINDAGEAAQIFVSILKGTGKDVSYASTLLDEFNQISNNAAITFDELASMTQRIAATLNTLGTDVEHTMGLITGAYEVLQDERVAKGISVIGLRMQGLNDDLEEEAGLQSKVNEALEKYAGISVFDARTGQLRDYFDVLQDLAGVWNNISKNAQVYLTTTLAGKNRADVLNALMANWKGVENAIQQATDSLGSAEKEQENYINSISGKLAQLSSAWQDLARSSWESDWSKGLVDMATAMLTVIRYGGGLIPVFVAATSAIIAFKVASIGATAAFGGLAVAIAAVVAIVGSINKAEAERKAALDESNQKIQENIDKLKTQYDKYSQLRGEVDSLKEEQEKLMAIEEKTAEQKKQLTQITKQLAAAQKELNDYVGEGAGVTEEYSLELLRQIGAKASEYVHDIRNIEEYHAAQSGLGSQKFTSVETGWNRWTKSAENRAADYGIKAYRLPSGYEMLEFEGTVDEYIEALNNLYEQTYRFDKDLALDIKAIADRILAQKEAYEEVIATFEKYRDMAELYGDVNTKAIDNLQKSYQKWTNATVEQKIAMTEQDGELTKNLAAVEALKEKYPAAADEIDSFTQSILNSVEAFRQQDRYIDEITKRISSVSAEREAWEAEKEERDTAAEYQAKKDAVAKAEKALAEARGDVTDQEKARLEMQLKIAQAQLEAVELADKETEEKKKQLEYEEKVYAVQKAEAELAEARNKKIQVFRAGQGMVYIDDYSAVEAASRSLQTARQNLAEFSAERSAEKRRKKAQDAVDAAQEALDAYKEVVNKAEDIAKAEKDLAEAIQALSDYEKELQFKSRTADLQAYIDRYNDLVLKYGAETVRSWVDAHYGKLTAQNMGDVLDVMEAMLGKSVSRFPSRKKFIQGGESNRTEMGYSLGGGMQGGIGNVPSLSTPILKDGAILVQGNNTTYNIDTINMNEVNSLEELEKELESRTQIFSKDMNAKE